MRSINYKTSRKNFIFEDRPIRWGKGKKLMCLDLTPNSISGSGIDNQSASGALVTDSSPFKNIDEAFNSDVLCDGAYVIDKRHIDDIVLLISRPYHNPLFPALTASSLGCYITVKSVKDLPLDKENLPFQVSYDLYAEHWRRQGALIGRWNSKTRIINWEKK